MMTKQEALNKLKRLRQEWVEARDNYYRRGEGWELARVRCGARAAELEWAISVVDEITEL